MKKVWQFIVLIFKTIINIIVGILKFIFLIVETIFNIIDNTWKKIVKFFKPSYAVEVKLYHVIPGRVGAKVTRQQFGKGELKKATKFYEKVIKSTAKAKISPAEINLLKGKKSVMMTQLFGPVDLVKKLNVHTAA